MAFRKPYRLTSGSWVPARLTGPDMLLVLYAMILTPSLRAYDYAYESSETASALSAVERFAPLWAWSIPFGIGALLLLLGVLSRRHLVVYIGHSVLACTYTVLMVGIFAGVVGHPWLDGLRGASALLLPVALHWLCWWRTGPAPVKPSKLEPVETTGRATA